MSGAAARTRPVKNKTPTKKSRDEEDSDSDFEFDLVRHVSDICLRSFYTTYRYL